MDKYHCTKYASFVWSDDSGIYCAFGILEDTLPTLGLFQEFVVANDTRSVLRPMEDGLVKLLLSLISERSALHIILVSLRLQLVINVAN